MIRELTLGERVHVKLLPGQLLGGLTLGGIVIQKDRMPDTPPTLGRYLFPLGCWVYIIHPDLWEGQPGDHACIRLGEHDIEEIPQAPPG